MINQLEGICCFGASVRMAVSKWIFSCRQSEAVYTCPSNKGLISYNGSEEQRKQPHIFGKQNYKNEGRYIITSRHQPL